jgi:hypothetical protein
MEEKMINNLKQLVEVQEQIIANQEAYIDNLKQQIECYEKMIDILKDSVTPKTDNHGIERVTFGAK